MRRVTFVSFFVLSLAIGAGAYLAYVGGIPQLVTADPVARWFGATIAALFIVGAAYLGLQAWRADTRDDADASFGHLVVELSPAIGMLGTVVGLSLVFKNIGTTGALAGGAVAFYSTGCGLVGMILTKALVHVVERGIARGRQ